MERATGYRVKLISFSLFNLKERNHDGGFVALRLTGENMEKIRRCACFHNT
jgi:hypothetical protein